MNLHKGFSSSIHEYLIAFAFGKMVHDGYSNIKLNYKMPTGIIDLYGELDGKKIGIECSSQNSSYYRTIKKEFDKSLDKLIFCVPEKIFKVKSNFEFLVVPLAYFEKLIPKKKLPISLKQKDDTQMNIELDKDSNKSIKALCLDLEYTQKELIPILIKEGIKIVEAKTNGKRKKSKETEKQESC